MGGNQVEIIDVHMHCFAERIYLRLVKELALPPNVEAQLCSGNARRYLGSALPG